MQSRDRCLRKLLTYLLYFFFLRLRRPPRPTFFPYTPLFRSLGTRRIVPAVSTLVAFGARTIPGSSPRGDAWSVDTRSEEHTSELQSRRDLVCRLLLERKKTKKA